MNKILITKTRIAVFIFLVSLSNVAASQETDFYRVAFWNFENFFDPFVDSTKTYNEFTPDGAQHWTVSHFYKKRNNMYKAILKLSEAKPLAILGICEIENEYVLNMLFAQTPLKRFNYSWVHYDSPDRRGIDAALVYSRDLLQLVESRTVPLKNPADTSFKSRDILYAKFSDYRHDTLHVFVNHWPSRYGGEMETISLRALAARLLRSKVDSIASVVDNPKIVIMGDFNDCPDDISIKQVLSAQNISEADTAFLLNLFANSTDLGFEGTLKFQNAWQIFDQIIISKPLYDDTLGLHWQKNSQRIFVDNFMLQDDETYGGKKLWRTYVGQKYFGGFSDHLPVYIDLK